MTDPEVSQHTVESHARDDHDGCSSAPTAAFGSPYEGQAEPVAPDAETGSSVAMFVVRRFVEAIEQVGVPSDRVLRAIGIDQQSLRDSEARVPRSRLEKACELAMRPPHGDPALGLRWAQRETERTFEPVSYLLAHAATLRQAFELIARFEKIYCDEPICRLSNDGDTAAVRAVRRPGRSPELQRLGAELAVNGFLGMIASYGGRDCVERVCFEYPAPPYQSEYEVVLGHEAHFDEPFTGVVFDAAALDRPLQGSDADIRSALITVAERRLLRATRRAPYALRVRDLLARRMPDRVDMSTAARQLGVSERSLRTRLAEEGTSYPEVQRDVLKSVAETLIRDRGLSIQEAAYQMGFSGPDTFHRAFKRWTGTTPSEFFSLD